MVKVASETLTDGRFYDRFFALLDRFLVTGEARDTADEPIVTSPVAPVPQMKTAPMAPVAPIVPAPAETPVAPTPERG